ncbi:hemerythrin HHE cation binding domain-containing protein [Humibacillus xanthopallidus]|uniref:Hemerythrin HHE cation binding domain-containing protein n=1 Tax=Humibacillus xanthopallidus TaxID=412689 RepID=A0A543PP49_9MICO|nr:LLM class flavin-dependent oxidoreductase [Humibacillus xanthopallidus]TQN45856.1 hemerythrin HHE cation binding domain-containing protein [Humibacillus xanthopallidus]
MADYGHELQFGVFASPEVARVHDTLELAQLADVLGLDLFTVQDHPYNATHLDASTLLTAVAARTSTIRVAHNVANLPLRPPVGLAKEIATLDIVSGGRAELGLGTGAFWDAIVAAGGERRSPKEAVDALVEAIGVIRGTWGQDPDRRGERSVTRRGEHYTVSGLHAGPMPLHDVEIWLGAYKPRMLRVTGRLADGWLPSMGYADPAALAELNRVIDDAAVEAGRGPQAIRRMYNVFGRFGSGGGFLQGTADDWAEQLAGLTLEQGMSTYVLGSDDPDTVRRFADEVAPAVRELVQVERSRRASGSPVDAGETDGHPVGVDPDAALRSPVVRAGSPEGAPLAVRPTPDDGRRLSPSLPWREEDRPVTTKPDDAAYTPAQQAVPQHLVDVHDHLRSELAQVRDVVDQVRRGLLSVGQARSVINTMTMRQNSWTLGAYCESYCRIVTGHHTLEDRSIFPHLRRRQPSLTHVIDRLEQEHHVIADVLEQVDEALVAMVGSDGYGTAGREALDELQRTVDLLTDTLLSHLAYEERELVHPLAQHGFG